MLNDVIKMYDRPTNIGVCIVVFYSNSQKIWPFIFQSHTITYFTICSSTRFTASVKANWRKIYMRFWEELFKNLKEHHWHESLRKLTFPLLEEMKIFSVLTDVDLTSSVPSARMIQSAEVSDSFFEASFGLSSSTPAFLWRFFGLGGMSLKNPTKMKAR